jgi:general secretion pathway protein J
MRIRPTPLVGTSRSLAPRPNGFTLIEVLAALAVLGLLLVAVNQGIQYGLMASRIEARITAADGELTAVDLALRHLIEAMDPGSSDAGEVPLLAGRNTMTFVTDLPGTAGSALSRHALVALLVDARHRLILRWRPYLRAESTRRRSPMVDTELLGGVSRIELAFWRRSGGWVSAWRGDELPALIRVRLIFADGDHRHWPDIVVAPSLDRP